MGSRISVYTGSADAKTDVNTLIPAGATFDTTGTTPVDENVFKAMGRKVKAVVHHKKK